MAAIISASGIGTSPSFRRTRQATEHPKVANATTAHCQTTEDVISSNSVTQRKYRAIMGG